MQDTESAAIPTGNAPDVTRQTLMTEYARRWPATYFLVNVLLFLGAGALSDPVFFRLFGWEPTHFVSRLVVALFFAAAMLWGARDRARRMAAIENSVTP